RPLSAAPYSAHRNRCGCAPVRRDDWRPQVIPSKLKPPFQSAGLSQAGPGIKTIPTAEAGGKKGPSYRPLPVEFRSGGFNYRQIAREGDVAKYEQRWMGSENVCYEVVRIC